MGPDLSWENPRYAGYRKALKNAGVPFQENLILENPLSDSSSAYQTCTEFIHSSGTLQEMLLHTDAILCTTDLQAYGVLDCLKKNHVRVPEDISVMGVDNLPESARHFHSLTSMEFSGQEIGEKALLLLREVLEGKYPGGITRSYHGKIFERDSVCSRLSSAETGDFPPDSHEKDSFFGRQADKGAG